MVTGEVRNTGPVGTVDDFLAGRSRIAMLSSLRRDGRPLIVLEPTAVRSYA